MKTTITNETKSPSLTDRMKTYEQAYTQYLMKRTPVIIRLDGKAFHTWTTKLNRPFDDRLTDMMAETLQYLMQEIQGCVFAFSQSDEISLFLRDYDTLNTEAWFGSNLQKLVSVSASLTTAKFNQLASKYNLPLAHFDSRVFLLPKEEVVNYFIFRQHDGIRNSVQMLAQDVLGHKTCQNKNNIMLKEILAETGTPWESLDVKFRHGIAMRKDETVASMNLPLFKDDRSYIEELVYVKPE